VVWDVAGKPHTDYITMCQLLLLYPVLMPSVADLRRIAGFSWACCMLSARVAVGAL
jgi:hypothetical protein